MGSFRYYAFTIATLIAGISMRQVFKEASGRGLFLHAIMGLRTTEAQSMESDHLV